MRKARRTQPFWWLLFCLTALVGCGSDEIVKPDPEPVPEPLPTIVNIRIEVDAEVNPDVTGRTSPVVIRLYQLKEIFGFEAADYFSLFEDEKALLGDDLVESETFYLMPEQRMREQRTVVAGVRYLAVAASFRDINRAMWKEAVEIPLNTTSEIDIGLNDVVVKMSMKVPVVEEPTAEDPDGENAEGEDPDGEDPDGENAEGEDPDGEDPDGENAEGESPDGEDSDTENAEDKDPDTGKSHNADEAGTV